MSELPAGQMDIYTHDTGDEVWRQFWTPDVWQ